MFENMKLSTKLISSFLVVSLIGLTIGIIGVVNMAKLDGFVEKTYSQDLLGLSYIKEAKMVRAFASRDWRSALIETDLVKKRQKKEDVKNDIAKFEDNFKKAKPLFYNEESKKIIAEIEAQMPEWNRLTLELVGFIVDNNLNTRTPEFDAILAKQSVPGKVIDDAITLLVEKKETLSAQTAKESSDIYHTNLLILISIIVIGFIVSIAISLLFSRWIMRQLGGEITETFEQVRQISDGNFSNTIKLQPRDNSSLLYALKNLQDTINSFVSEQHLISQKHEQGFISHKIDVSKFKGTYFQMASDINKLVQSHIAVKMHIVDIVTQYAKGDFSRDIDNLPNEKAKITQTISEVKKSLLAVNKEIEVLAAAGAKGDFSKRANAQDFDFMFKNMLTHLNDLFDNSERAFGDVLRMSNALAQGDLTQSITTSYPAGTFENTKNALNGTVENLKALLIEIKESADTISTASQEIAAGNNDLSHRTERQAASLEETAASMHELTSTVQANSDNARAANEMALSSSDIALKGVNVVNQVVSTMEDINEASRKIVDIITVIDGIAFQTNILALNAAVEAARAGEQGRGFAVVASEVRSLAQRAAGAAGEIKGLISDSVDKVEDGTNLVAKAGKTMEEIVSSIQGVTTMITHITSASHEQTAGIQQVNHAIREMDDVTQQNAALVEEAAAAAESLEDQARKLSVTMGNFKIDGIKQVVTSTTAAPIKTYTPPVAKTAPVAKKVAAPVVQEPVEMAEKIDIDLDGALKKHADWKMKLRTAISNKEHLDAETISKDNCCDFGKWLHNEDTHPKLAHLQSYHDCVERHAKFHQAAGAIARVINAKNYAEADKMLNDTNGDFVKNSSDVGAAIMRLKKDTAPKPKPVVKKAVEEVTNTLSDEWEEF